MKHLHRLILSALVLMSVPFFAKDQPSVSVGDKAIDFSLKNVDGTEIKLSNYKTKGVILIFTCNHCPYAQAYEERIIALQSKYKETYPVIAINPNDSAQYPDDSYSNMQKKVIDKKWDFPYLLDGSQDIAKKYGALKTPHVYLLLKEGSGYVIKYIGAIDDNYEDEKLVKVKYLENAISSLEEGKNPQPSTTKAIGCGIKWKK